MKNIIKALCFTLLGLVSACGGGGSGDGSGGSCSVLNAKVFNGDTCNANAQTPVVGIFPVIKNGSQLEIAGICTGTLVTVNDILTSAHCFVGPVSVYGRQIAGFVVVAGGADGEGIVLNRVKIHPQYNGQAGSPYDVAMATLSRVPSPPIGPLPIAVSESTNVGDIITTFGYGTGNAGEIGQLKAADIEVADVQGGNIFGSLETSGASICQGDSGGPAIRKIGGVAALAGVNSFGSANASQCASAGASLFGFVDTYRADIVNFIRDYAPDISER